MPRPFPCSIGWTVCPPKPKINAASASKRLRDLGHELRRPEADYLRDGIYELRVGLRGMNYRMLYFFHGRVAAVLAHGLVKEREVPPREIEEAIRRRRKFELDPERHTYKEG
jgi:phage-related protein